MDLRDEITRFSTGVDKATALAVRDLEKFWWLPDFDTPAQAREAVLDFVPKLVSVYGDVAGAAALHFGIRRIHGTAVYSVGCRRLSTGG